VPFLRCALEAKPFGRRTLIVVEGAYSMLGVLVTAVGHPAVATRSGWGNTNQTA